MTEQTPTLTRHDLEAKIVKRSWENEGFRKEFTSDPMGTAAKYLQVPAASLPKIVIHHEEPGTWHIVLPAKPANASELTDADLEGVAGGMSIPVALVGVSAAINVTFSAALVVDVVGGGW